ncbi:hypothetical protein JTE90_021393 [Oedothorax gibbosus]|uniref:Cytochrome P450 n=1 Tax=Oedothorax gibbosus TaxID=931172 RepID=A0AAV6VEJ9_9ARAC|nr:hypothetical protein JTE90_021393 [Oedothorax gibbosus]
MWAVTLIAVAVVLWLLYRKKWFSSLKEQGIPGPEPNLLFGNLFDLIRKGPLVCKGEWIKKYGNVVGYYFGATPVVIVADADLLKRILVSDFHKFINRPNLSSPVHRVNKSALTKREEGYSQRLVFLRDKRWKEIRSIITPTFTASKMKQMAPIMNGAIDSLLDNIEKQGSSEFNIHGMYQRLTMDVIGRTAFGIQTDVQNNPDDLFLRCAKGFFQNDTKNPILLLSSSFQSLNFLWTAVGWLKVRATNKGTNPVNELIQSVKDVIASRRSNKESRRNDLLQLMIDAEIDDLSTITSDDLTAKDDNEEKTTGASSGKLTRRMTDADILDNSVMFFLVGYETTSTALAFTTHFLIHYPEAQEKLRQEVQNLIETEGDLDYSSVNKLQYLDEVIHESLRLFPPIYQFHREVAEDVELGKYKLKKGCKVEVSANHMHRNPELWGSDADEFKPERFSPENKKNIHPMAYQSFGAGPRNCVGMRFAYMEAKLALARLLAKYRLVTSSKTESLDGITLKIAPTILTPRNGIWLKAVPV